MREVGKRGYREEYFRELRVAAPREQGFLRLLP